MSFLILHTGLHAESFAWFAVGFAAAVTIICVAVRGWRARG